MTENVPAIRIFKTTSNVTCFFAGSAFLPTQSALFSWRNVNRLGARALFIYASRNDLKSYLSMENCKKSKVQTRLWRPKLQFLVSVQLV